MSERLVLAIDTSFGPVGATLLTTSLQTMGRIEADNPAGTQAETLPPIVSKLFAGQDFKDLARIAVTVGPGAFTGVRVGLAFAKGLRLATGAEVLGFTTLDCMAAQAARDVPGADVGVVIDAKRGEAYVQAFTPQSEPLTEAAVMPLGDAAALLKRVLKPRMVLVGSGVALLEGVSDVDRVPFERIDTELLARRAVTAELQRYPAVPAYLRAADARLPA